MAIVYAHRGASLELPENTLPAFRRALEVGADALETDAHVTRDGVVVLAHDDHGGRTCGVRRRIADCTWAEVKTWDAGWGHRDRTGFRPFVGRDYRVPSLEEVLAALPEARFNLDAKRRDHGAVDRIIDTIRGARAEERVHLASFHVANLRQVRATHWRGGTGLAQREVIRLITLPLALLRRLPLGGGRAQVPTHVGRVRLDTRAFLDKAHTLGLKVDYWVIDDPIEARRLVELGADGVMTDDPASIVPAVH
jgi:glycerophosphoryl diester phosphodiesterase